MTTMTFLSWNMLLPLSWVADSAQMARRPPARTRSGPRPTSRAARSAVEPPRRGDWVLRGAVLAVLLVLAAVADDRHVGLIADGRQMIRTAVAIVETGGIGQAIGRDFTIERGSGDAISRFGFRHQPVAAPGGVRGVTGGIEIRAGQLPVAVSARPVARGRRRRSRRGTLARLLGGADWQTAAAVLLASVACRWARMPSSSSRSRCRRRR